LFDKIADNLLNEFMDKEVLYEPMKEAEKNYENYLNSSGHTLEQKEYERFEN